MSGNWGSLSNMYDYSKWNVVADSARVRHIFHGNADEVNVDDHEMVVHGAKALPISEYVESEGTSAPGNERPHGAQLINYPPRVVLTKNWEVIYDRSEN